jgi:hypothetical protein
MPGSGYSMFMNDRGIPEIRIAVREFKCFGVSPPQDHPHGVQVFSASTLVIEFLPRPSQPAACSAIRR